MYVFFPPIFETVPQKKQKKKQEKKKKQANNQGDISRTSEIAQ
jgi:hypothetical protein